MVRLSIYLGNPLLASRNREALYSNREAGYRVIHKRGAKIRSDDGYKHPLFIVRPLFNFAHLALKKLFM